MPKSSTFGRPLGATKTLSGLRSRWTMPLPCAAPSASSTSVASRASPPSGSDAPIREMRSARGAPSRYSITMNGRPSGSVARSSTFTMLSWRMRFTARASEKNRSTRSLRSAHSRDSTLIATRLPICGCTPL
jgi:hypothetical protein